MAGTTDSASEVWTATDLVARFGPIPLDRIRTSPAPGRATERDVIEIHDREKRLCELFRGTLVEKPMGSFESYLAAALVRLIGNFVAENDLGIVLTADGMLRLSRGLVRIPDASFISWARLPGRELPHEEIWGLALTWPSRSSARAIRGRKCNKNWSTILAPACAWFGTSTPPRVKSTPIASQTPLLRFARTKCSTAAPFCRDSNFRSRRCLPRRASRSNLSASAARRPRGRSGPPPAAPLRPVRAQRQGRSLRPSGRSWTAGSLSR